MIILNPTKVVKYELKRQRKRVMSMPAWLRAPSGSPSWLFHEWALPPRSTHMVSHVLLLVVVVVVDTNANRDIYDIVVA